MASRIEEGRRRRQTFDRRSFLGAAALASGVLPLLSCASNPSRSLGSQGISESAGLYQDELTEKLLEAAREEGIAVDKNAVSIGITPKAVIVNGAVAGLSAIDMIRYEDGVQTNFVYIDSKETSLARGFYAVTTVAEQVQLGQIRVEARYSQGGRLIVATPGYALITSLRVPPDLPPLVETGVSILQTPNQSAGDKVPQFTWYTRCSNGGWWCHSMPCPGGC